MKKYTIAAILSFTTISSVWAAQTATPVMNMNEHQQAMIAHETMNNGSAAAHQQTAEMHKKMAGVVAQEKGANMGGSFSVMNEHEQAAIARSFSKNGQSGPHRLESEKHLQMMQ